MKYGRHGDVGSWLQLQLRLRLRLRLPLLLKLPLLLSPVERAVTAMPEADKVRRLSERSGAERV
jgi:hypothetical protein